MNTDYRMTTITKTATTNKNTTTNIYVPFFRTNRLEIVTRIKVLIGINAGAFAVKE